MTTIPRHLIERALEAIMTSKTARVELALQIQKHRALFNETIMNRILGHYSDCGADAVKRTIGALADGSWVDLNLGLAEEESKRSQDGEHEAKADADTSGMKLVTADNPYGWAKPDQKRRHDHNIPGKWNAYRQCFNLLAQERVTTGNHDFRYRGCSRVEVLGQWESELGWRPGQKMPPIANPKKPRVRYDAIEVAVALGNDPGMPQEPRS